MEHYSIGKVAATHGLQGEIVLKHALGKKTDLKDLKNLFIKEKNGSLLPWFIEATRIKNDAEIYIKLETVNTVDAARTLVQKEVWLAQKDFEKYAAKAAPISLLGYTIVDDGKALGTIEEIIEQPHQILCRLTIQGKEVLIPLHEEFLKNIDNKNRKVMVKLPDGLLDIYLKIPSK